MANLSILYLIGLGLVLAGIVILIVAVMLVIALSNKDSKVNAAGVIIVGPLPIVFGSDKKTVKTILKLTITLMVTLIVFSLIYYFLLR